MLTQPSGITGFTTMFVGAGLLAIVARSFHFLEELAKPIPPLDP